MKPTSARQPKDFQILMLRQAVEQERPTTFKDTGLGDARPTHVSGVLINSAHKKCIEPILADSLARLNGPSIPEKNHTILASGPLKN